MLVGAAIYPTLYVCGATYMSDGEGWAASMAMLLCSTGTFLAAWTAQFYNPLFRVAPQRTNNQHIFRTFVQTSIFWFLSLAVAPWLLLQAEQALHIPKFHTPLQQWLPWLFFALFGTINLYTGYTMSNWGKGTPLPLETARVLVVRGPYRYVRNPMAITGLSLGVMVGWWLGSWLTLITVFIGGLVWHCFVRPIEEKDLEERFGEEYIRYKQHIRNWIPTKNPSSPTPSMHGLDYIFSYTCLNF
jgi:protein-S-isoprenylcysteine O-methyltransferase Ste14